MHACMYTDICRRTFIHSLIHSFLPSVLASFVHYSFHHLIQSFMRLFSRSLSRSAVHSVIRSFIHPVMHSFRHPDVSLCLYYMCLTSASQTEHFGNKDETIKQADVRSRRFLRDDPLIPFGGPNYHHTVLANIFVFHCFLAAATRNECSPCFATTVFGRNQRKGRRKSCTRE